MDLPFKNPECSSSRLRLTGHGHSAAKRVLSVLNLPPPINKDSWSNQPKCSRSIRLILLQLTRFVDAFGNFTDCQDCFSFVLLVKRSKT